MRSMCICLLSPWAATLAFWSFFGACVAAGPPNGAPTAHVIVDWDPTACGPRHRVVLELAVANSPPLSVASPCELGSAELDGVLYGSYDGRLYAWALGEDVRSVAPVHVDVDERVIRWTAETPR
jgi:hypothetical protein